MKAKVMAWLLICIIVAQNTFVSYHTEAFVKTDVACTVSFWTYQLKFLTTLMLTLNRQFTAAAHASAHLNAQKLNRSSSSKNLRILRQTKKVPLRASNVCNKYLTNESLEAAFSFFFLLLPRRTAAAQSSRNKTVLDYELGKIAPLRGAGSHGPFFNTLF